MTCTCVKAVNEQLAQQNGQLAIGFGITKDMGLISRLLIGTEKKDKSKREKPPIVSATFCPFCGTKFDGCAMKQPKEAATKGGCMTHPFRRTLISIAVDQVIGQRPDPIKLELDQLWLEAGRRLLPLDRSHVTDLGIGYHAAMHAIAHGDGTIDHAGTLACVANIAMLLVEQGLGDDEHLQVIQQAQDSLVVMLQRGQRHGRYLLDGTGLTRVNEMLAIHDEQLSHPACTPALVQSALIEVRRRMAAGNTLEIA